MSDSTFFILPDAEAGDAKDELFISIGVVVQNISAEQVYQLIAQKAIYQGQRNLLLADLAELLSTCRTLSNLIRDLLPLIPAETIKEAGLQKRVLAANEKAFKANQKAGAR